MQRFDDLRRRAAFPDRRSGNLDGSVREQLVGVETTLQRGNVFMSGIRGYPIKGLNNLARLAFGRLEEHIIEKTNDAGYAGTR